jgi:transcriptional regulator with XRE-family HTH domain
LRILGSFKLWSFIYIFALKYKKTTFVFFRENKKYTKGGNEMRIMFGEYIHQKRISKEIPLREFARRVGISPEYVCNIEKGRKAAPSSDVLEKIIVVLSLNNQEVEQVYDLAANSKSTENAIPEDLALFLNENKHMIKILRNVRDLDVSREEWDEFLQLLKLNRKERK